MANYWAIAIGINQYKHFQPLMYAQRDAQIFRDALIKDAGFPAKQCFLLTDSVPGINRTEAVPNRDSIQACIAHTCRQRLHPGDVLWCFFSGYGVRVDGKEYLMPIEADPNSAATTGIPIEWLFSTFGSARTSNIVLVLDVNRSQGIAGEGIGDQTTLLAKEHGIATLLSCRSDQFSYETLALRQGFFTTALLEGIRYQKCSTLEQLVQYLDDRLPELSEHHWRPPQNPVSILPANKKHLLILPDKEAVEAGHRAANAVSQSNLTGETQRTRRIPVYGYPRSERSTTIDAEPTPFSYRDTMKVGEPIGGDRVHRNPPVRDPISGNLIGEEMGRSGGANSDQALTNYPSVLMNPEWETSHEFPGKDFADEPIQSPSIEPISPEEQPEISDRLFWRRLLTWGGILAAVLLIGVIVRHSRSAQSQNNTASFTGAPIAQADPASPQLTTPPPPSQPAIQAEPGSPLETAYVAARSRRFQDAKQYLEQVPSNQQGADYQKVLDETNKGLLSDAKVALTRTRELTNENQASDFVEALETVRLIRPDEPHYTEAQEYVDRWSRVVFDMAQGRADRRNDSSSSLAAENYSTAIRTVRLIPDDAPIYGQAQTAIAQWSQRLFELANDRAIEGKYDVAVYVGELIPTDAPIYPEAQAAIESWRTQPTLYIAPTP
jgi:uncharacterized caspase-like protein